MRKLLVAGMATLLSLAIMAAPASAKKYSADDFDYVATIDCGPGPAMVVGAGVETSSPFVDLKTGRTFLPVEWHVTFEGGSFDEVIENSYKGRRMVCSYDDGFATGEVTVVKANGKKNR